MATNRTAEFVRETVRCTLAAAALGAATAASAVAPHHHLAGPSAFITSADAIVARLADAEAALRLVECALDVHDCVLFEADEAIVAALCVMRQCGAELAELERYVELFSGTPGGRALPYRAAHQVGVVATLHQRLQALSGYIKALSSRLRTAQREGGTLLRQRRAPTTRLVRIEQLPRRDAPRERARDPPMDDDATADGVGAPPTLLRRRGAPSQQPRLLHPNPPAAAASTAAFHRNDDDDDVVVHAGQLTRGRESLREHALEEQMRDVSDMLSLIANKLAEQQGGVQAILEDAVEARSNVQAGNQELREVNERPSSLRDFVVAFMLVVTAALWFLDWYA